MAGMHHAAHLAGSPAPRGLTRGLASLARAAVVAPREHADLTSGIGNVINPAQHTHEPCPRCRRTLRARHRPALAVLQPMARSRPPQPPQLVCPPTASVPRLALQCATDWQAQQAGHRVCSVWEQRQCRGDELRSLSGTNLGTDHVGNVKGGKSNAHQWWHVQGSAKGGVAAAGRGHLQWGGPPCILPPVSCQTKGRQWPARSEAGPTRFIACVRVGGRKRWMHLKGGQRARAALARSVIRSCLGLPPLISRARGPARVRRPGWPSGRTAGRLPCRGPAAWCCESCLRTPWSQARASPRSSQTWGAGVGAEGGGQAGNGGRHQEKGGSWCTSSMAAHPTGA